MRKKKSNGICQVFKRTYDRGFSNGKFIALKDKY